MSSNTKKTRRFRLGPAEDEISFRQLQKKHGHLIKNVGRFVATYPKQDNNLYQHNLNYAKPKPVFKGYLPKTEVLKNEDAGSQANVLVYPEDDIRDNEIVDDVPKYIYTTKFKKQPGYDTANKIVEKVNPRVTQAMKEQERLQSQRKIVDTMIDDYLCNHNYGHVIPWYEGTGVLTCECCTDRNRENVRNVLGLPPDPDNTVSPRERNSWLSTTNESGKDVKYNVYPLGRQHKHQVQALKIDPAFRLSDATTRNNWASSATFNMPDFYKQELTRSYPDYVINKKNSSLPRLFPNIRTTPGPTYISPNYNAKKWSSFKSKFKERTADMETIRESDYGYLFNRVSSADRKYNLAMGNLRKFKAR
ncbi:Hypothetical predicted protein [Mytilus galloprovincialis]|uniref:Uncharacterized protein n=1 Tax=Mytilus galloprovincialis TaxID=29158 RepID=A0A8B6H2A6_MYTGA|nr:Hypothetical predicted protein [Mytilus galloprovincialis]